MHSQLNLTDTNFDALLQGYIMGAIDHCERRTGKCLVPTTIVEMFEYFPLFPNMNYRPTVFYPLNRFYNWWNPSAYKIELQRSPVQSMTSIQYWDAQTNTLTTMPSNMYYVMTPYNMDGWVAPKPYWPASYPRPDSISMTYLAGYNVCPESFRQAIILIVSSWFNAREDINYGPDTVGHEVGMVVDNLLQAFTPMSAA